MATLCLPPSLRDSSIQGRHRDWIIEEAPTTSVVNPKVFHKMELTAIKLAKMVGKVSSGTVECLYQDNAEFHFGAEPTTAHGGREARALESSSRSLSLSLAPSLPLSLPPTIPPFPAQALLR